MLEMQLGLLCLLGKHFTDLVAITSASRCYLKCKIQQLFPLNPSPFLGMGTGTGTWGRELYVFSLNFKGEKKKKSKLNPTIKF